jgi:hypothetical protein
MGKLVLAVAAVTLVVGVAYALTQQTFPPDAGSACLNSLTPAEFNSWFDNGFVSLNGAVRPADSLNFPNIPNCSFYKWSEQMFLWLTSPAPPRYGGGGGDLIMNTSAFYDVTPPDDKGNRYFQQHSATTVRAFNLRTGQTGALDLPVVLEKGSLRVLEVLPPVLSSAGRQMVADQNGNAVEVGSAQIPSHGKPILLDAGGRQIQGVRALLKPEIAKKMAALPGFDRSELVQRITFKGQPDVMVGLAGNFAEAEQGQADGGVLMAQNGSLVYYTITVNNVFALFRTMQGAGIPAGLRFPTTPPELNNIINFAAANGMAPVIDAEALAVEIKTAWIESATLANPNDFIQVQAIVPTYDTSNPNDWVPNGTKTIMLAMVGMHIVGSANGHPEMLWGTFEHVSNDPLAQYDYARAPGGVGTIPLNTIGNWLFCANGAVAPFNQAHMRMAAAGHIQPVAPFPISPTNVVRSKPWGLDGTNALGNAEVISLNNIVRNLLDPNDVRRNYFHGGTTWTVGGAPPGVGNQAGTNKLSNTTMETFTQGGNCFGCHGTNTTAVSHIFADTQPLF